MEKRPYYITTAIAYASGKPHIGNTYEIVLADAIARFRTEQGYDVRFQTGTDEHGEKIEQKALAAGVTPKEYVDNVAGEIKDIFDLMNPSEPVDLTFRSASQSTVKSTGQLAYNQMRVVEKGRLKSFTPGTLEQGKQMNASVTLEVLYILIEVDGVDTVLART